MQVKTTEVSHSGSTPLQMPDDDHDELQHLIDKEDRPESNGPLYILLEKRSDLNLAGKIRGVRVQCGHGGYSDIFTGMRTTDTGTEYKFAVKKLRAHIMEDRKFQKRLAKELYIWSKLKHHRILPLEGFYIENDNYPHLVSKWMEKGTVMKYLETHLNADVLSLANGIAEGIQFLHENGIIHADIKPDNVLISDLESPLLCDFGVSRLLASSDTFPISTTRTGGMRGTTRFMSREILEGTDAEYPTYTKESDVWAFGMTIFTLLTRHMPYHDILIDVRVVLAIIEGRLPSWPEDSKSWPAVNQTIRRLCESCWEAKSVRPTIDVLVSELYCIALARRQKEEELRAKGEALERHRKELQRREEELARREEEEEREKKEEQTRKEAALRHQQEEELRAKEEALERRRRELQRREEELARREEEEERQKQEEQAQKEASLRRRQEEDHKRRLEEEKLDHEMDREEEERQQEELFYFYKQRKAQEEARTRDPRRASSSSSFSSSIPNLSSSFSSASGTLPSSRAAPSATSTHSIWDASRPSSTKPATSAPSELSRIPGASSSSSVRQSIWRNDELERIWRYGLGVRTDKTTIVPQVRDARDSPGQWMTNSRPSISRADNPTSHHSPLLSSSTPRAGTPKMSNVSRSISEEEWRRRQEELARKQREQFLAEQLRLNQSSAGTKGYR